SASSPGSSRTGGTSGDCDRGVLRPPDQLRGPNAAGLRAPEGPRGRAPLRDGLLKGRAAVTCPECGSLVLLDERRGETVCTSCQLVVEDRMIDDAPMTTRGDSYTGPGGDGHGPALSVQNPVTMTTRPQVVSRDASGRSLSPSVA